MDIVWVPLCWLRTCIFCKTCLKTSKVVSLLFYSCLSVTHPWKQHHAQTLQKNESKTVLAIKENMKSVDFSELCLIEKKRKNLKFFINSGFRVTGCHTVTLMQTKTCFRVGVNGKWRTEKLMHAPWNKYSYMVILIYRHILVDFCYDGPTQSKPF